MIKTKQIERIHVKYSDHQRRLITGHSGQDLRPFIKGPPLVKPISVATEV